MSTDELLVLLRQELADTVEPFLWSDDELLTYLNDAQVMLARKTDGIPDASTPAVTQLAITPGVEWYPLHAKVLKVRTAIRRSDGGRLEVLKRTTRGDCRVVARAGRGSTVGEMALFDRSPRSATVVARQPSVVVLLTRKGFDLLTARHPALGLSLVRTILRLLSLNMRLTTSRLADQLPG